MQLSQTNSNSTWLDTLNRAITTYGQVKTAQVVQQRPIVQRPVTPVIQQPVTKQVNWLQLAPLAIAGIFLIMKLRG